MDKKKNVYNMIYSLLEEEIYQRKNPSQYNNNRVVVNKGENMLHVNNQIMHGGFNSEKSNNNIIPGKADVIRESYRLPLNMAIEGSRKRQELYMKEK